MLTSILELFFFFKTVILLFCINIKLHYIMIVECYDIWGNTGKLYQISERENILFPSICTDVHACKVTTHCDCFWEYYFS